MMTKHAKPLKLGSILLAGSILLSSCASTTLIQSNPEGAKVYINGESIGTTPYTHSDTRIVGSTISVKLEKEGYEPLNTTISRNEEADVGAIIGGCFFFVPFLWTMKYQPSHTYDLTPIAAGNQPKNTPSTQQNQTKSKTEELRELKQLLDENILTQEEYEIEKKKILEKY